MLKHIPHTVKLQEVLEKVQNRAARFVTRNFVYETGSMTGILGQLKWKSLKKRRKDNRLILLYKGLKCKARMTGSMTGILGQLKWKSLKKRRKDNRLILLYKGLKCKARIPTDDLIPKTRRGRSGT